MLAVFLLMNGFFLPMAKVNAMRGSEGRKLFQERKKKAKSVGPGFATHKREELS